MNICLNNWARLSEKITLSDASPILANHEPKMARFGHPQIFAKEILFEPARSAPLRDMAVFPQFDRNLDASALGLY